MKADVFISYKSEEEEYARRVRKVLEDNGMTCWMAPDSIPVGSNYMKQIPQAIDSCKVMIVLVSEKSQKSTWVKNEFSQAISKNKLVIPYVIQDCPLEDEFAFSMSTMQQVFAWKNEEEALTKVVKDLKEVLGSDSNARIEISVVKKPRVSPIIIGVLAALLVIGIFVFFNRQKTPVPSSSASEVYYSELLPYYMTGYYQNADQAKVDQSEYKVYDRAVSLLSFVRNDSDKSVFVEKIACEMEEVTPLQEAVIVTDGALIDNTFFVYAINDGWGDAREVKAEWSMTPGDPWSQGEDIPIYPELIESMSGSATFDVNAGEAYEIIRQKVDLSGLLEWARSQGDTYLPTLYTLSITMKYGDNKEAGMIMMLMYDKKTDSIIIDYGGADDDKPSITLYGILDVDNPPAEIRFLSPEANPLVEDTYRIETVIIPTKSCTFTMKGSYSIGGELFETEAYPVTVSVPYFTDKALTMGGSLTRELAHSNMNDPELMRKICARHRYDIQSILPDDAPRG